MRFIFEGNDWEADPLAPARENWKRTSPVRLSGGWFKNQFAEDDEQGILTWGKANARDIGNMWVVSQDGLSAEKVAQGNADTQYWVFDHHTPILRMDSLDPATTRVFRKVGEDWVKLVDIDLGDDFYPMFIKTDGSLVARSARSRDKTALVNFDITTGQETVLVANPNANIAGTTFLKLHGEPDILRMGDQQSGTRGIDAKGASFLGHPRPISATRFVGFHIANRVRALCHAGIVQSKQVLRSLTYRLAGKILCHIGRIPFPSIQRPSGPRASHHISSP